MTLACTDVTCNELVEIERGRNAAVSEVFWKGEHSVTHHRIEVKRRADRPVKDDPTDNKMLISMYEQNKQILQTRVSAWETEAVAVNFMVGIAIDYAADKVSKSELRSHQRALLEALPKKVWSHNKLIGTFSNGHTFIAQPFCGRHMRITRVIAWL